MADTYWGPLDVLLVDMPPGTGDATLSLLELQRVGVLGCSWCPRTAWV